MADAEPQGCLTAILGILGFSIGRKKARQEPQLPYRVRDDFLSRAERSFFGVLLSAVRDQGIICPKVSLGDIFFVADFDQKRAYRNKIDRKHVDFLICDPKTMRPLVGVELDDKSHGRADRRDRDAFVDQVFAAAELPLLHEPARAAYELQSLAAKLMPYLKMPPPTVPDVSTAVGENSPTPICPKCGVPMIERTASKGPHAGRRFWGCSNFPQCRETR